MASGSGARSSKKVLSPWSDDTIDERVLAIVERSGAGVKLTELGKLSPGFKPPAARLKARVATLVARGQVHAWATGWLGAEPWERAARGGLSGQRFPWGNTITTNLANYFGSTTLAYDLGPNGYSPMANQAATPYTSPVGSFAPNGYGLYDMAGQLMQICWDWYGTPYAGGADPRGPATGTERVRHGGSFADTANIARVSARFTFSLSGQNIYNGFRTVRSIP
jgi:hypothetical protein